jgi:hypothetical protein
VNGNRLSSRKLVALLGGLTAICVVVGFAVFGGTVPMFDKVLLGITTLTMTAIGAQTLLDRNGNGNGNGTS